MTIKSIKDKDFMHWQVRDLSTGEVLENVEYADDSTGLHIVRTRYDRGTILRVLKTGNIKLEDKRAKCEPPERDLLQEALEQAREVVARLEEQIAERNRLGEMINDAFIRGARSRL